MATVQINQNYGNVTVADSIYQCSTPEEQAACDWQMTYFPALFSGYKDPEKEARKAEEERMLAEAKAKEEHREHQLDELVSMSIEALREEVTRNA